MTSPAAAPLLPGELADALADVRLDLPTLRARVGQEDVSAQSPEDLRSKLASALYRTLHTGAPPRDENPGLRARRDPDLELRFRAGMPHRRTVSPVRLLERRPADGTVLVELDGIRVRLPEERLMAAGPRDLAAHDAARPALSPGFFFAHGSQGRAPQEPVLRLYVHLRHPDAAVATWTAALRVLERQALPYQAKVLSAPQHYPRRDALVLYLTAAHRTVADEVATAVSDVEGLGTSTSLLAQRLAPGVAVAWEPADDRPGMQRLSFGQHRAHAIAEGLLAHARHPLTPRQAAIAQAMRAASVDPAAPHRNLPSS
ncbi:T3SS effector HopA1 family protein [Streptomyces sp. ET3-23]|uniref:T3SS effector HopA1 family protein n=1 Tax=Streptomyces sp. ET3-23 TaxID=2885643 RepID=UPI001D102DC1|nr:T3SS effector HopA1 family protein [Streptomyces sp. ET3-23]MCC2280506.1 T3SS effector HopA1 family protein [Streptomyces sp. ET3-23]